jgi:hypothetical protein
MRKNEILMDLRFKVAKKKRMKFEYLSLYIAKRDIQYLYYEARIINFNERKKEKSLLSFLTFLLFYKMLASFFFLSYFEIIFEKKMVCKRKGMLKTTKN